MIVKQIWTANSYRNFNYLIACSETGEALAIDPLDSVKCIEEAKNQGWQITQILNTHEHHDHIGGNEAVVKATGAKVLAHANAGRSIKGMFRGLIAGDVIKVGKTVELEALDTPGHTMCHICLLSHTDEPALFSGDTLFNAGAGNCHNGGNLKSLYQTFSRQLNLLPDNTWIYPGHDYIENNLRFTLDREPDNTYAAELLQQVTGQDVHTAYTSSMQIERQVNTFFRLDSVSIQSRLRTSFSDLPLNMEEETVFSKLRELRNHW
ncbi:MAG: hydroxyacylglutathione hydrolase [Betaproteobacteria bacterium]|nr:hydroxyacylglutathione hydrolase [Betaproteobacteria bacterium]